MPADEWPRGVPRPDRDRMIEILAGLAAADRGDALGLEAMTGQARAEGLAPDEDLPQWVFLVTTLVRVFADALGWDTEQAYRHALAEFQQAD